MQTFNFLNLSFYDLVFYFVIYSFLGWCVEVAYAYKNQKRFVNRGFLHGPLCPIYGSCILSLVVLLNNFKANLVVLLIIATLLTSVIEYFTGYLLEKLFKRKYWDYTEDPLNIHGRICLHFSVMWGIASMAVVRIIHPMIELFVHSLTPSLGAFLFYFLLISLILDFSSTLAKLIDFKKLAFTMQIDSSAFINRFNTSRDSLFAKNIEDIFEDLKYKFSKWIGK